MITIREVVNCLEAFAPRAFQESYDNSGLLTGNSDWKVSAALITLDCTEQVVDEAIRAKSNLIIAHHPIIFRGLKKLTGQNYVERTVIKAIKNDIAIYAIHTNLDNVHLGVNKKIAEKIGLKNLRVLSPKTDTLSKLVTFVPKANLEEVMTALHEAGAGNIGDYKDCSFRIEGTGTFRPIGEADPHIGQINQLEKVDEMRVEVIFPNHLEGKLLSALRKAHPYEEVAHYINRLANENQEAGSGIVGELPEAEEPIAFLKRLKKDMVANCVRHTAIGDKKVKKVAVCGGAGSFLLPQAIRAGADVFVSADFKYHEFFDAEGKIIVADIGHYESEQFTKELISEVLWEKFPTFAINFSKEVTNPISYL